MSVYISYGKYVPICDYCGEELPPCCDFQEAVLSMGQHGWETRRIDDEWEDVCDYCQEADK